MFQGIKSKFKTIKMERGILTLKDAVKKLNYSWENVFLNSHNAIYKNYVSRIYF